MARSTSTAQSARPAFASSLRSGAISATRAGTSTGHSCISTSLCERPRGTPAPPAPVALRLEAGAAAAARRGEVRRRDPRAASPTNCAPLTTRSVTNSARLSSSACCNWHPPQVPKWRHGGATWCGPGCRVPSGTTGRPARRRPGAARRGDPVSLGGDADDLFGGNRSQAGRVGPRDRAGKLSGGESWRDSAAPPRREATPPGRPQRTDHPRRPGGWRRLRRERRRSLRSKASCWRERRRRSARRARQQRCPRPWRSRPSRSPGERGGACDFAAGRSIRRPVPARPARPHAGWRSAAPVRSASRRGASRTSASASSTAGAGSASTGANASRAAASRPSPGPTSSALKRAVKHGFGERGGGQITRSGGATTLCTAEQFDIARPCPLRCCAGKQRRPRHRAGHHAKQPAGVLVRIGAGGGASRAARSPAQRPAPATPIPTSCNAPIAAQAGIAKCANFHAPSASVRSNAAGRRSAPAAVAVHPAGQVDRDAAGVAWPARASSRNAHRARAGSAAAEQAIDQHLAAPVAREQHRTAVERACVACRWGRRVPQRSPRHRRRARGWSRR